MKENLQNQGVSPVQLQNIIGGKRNLVIVFALVTVGIILLGGAFYTIVKFAENRQISGSNKELSEWYSVEYPNNFFVVRRDYRTFAVAENRWKGKPGHIPEATIEMYTGVLPDGMSLKDWVNGVGDPNPPIGEKPPKSCKEFLDTVRQKVKFGDLFNGDNCIYFGVSDIKETTIAGLPAIEFSTENVSSSARHTIVGYKNQLFDIYYTITGLSDEKDQTVAAYKSFVNTFKIRSE